MHDCVIIGGGVIGLSIAYELSRNGQRVAILERGQVGKEASWAGAGILPPGAGRAEDHPLEQLAGLSSSLHARWAATLKESTGIDNGYRPCGGIYIARDEAMAAALAEHAESCAARGIEVVQLKESALQQIEPSLEGIVSAVLLPGEAQLRNPWHLEALQAACTQQGVEFFTETPVEDFTIEGERIVAAQTPAGAFFAGKFCITSGAWSSAVAQRLGLDVNVKPVRGQMVLLRTGQPVLSHVVNEGPRYLVPRSDGRLLAGSTEEDAGFDRRTTARGVAGLIDLATSLVPGLADAEIERTWAGLRPATEDGLPYLGAMPRTSNGFIAAGHFRSGLTLSTGTALVMAQLICDEEPDIELGVFSPSRHTRTAELQASHHHGS